MIDTRGDSPLALLDLRDKLASEMNRLLRREEEEEEEERESLILIPGTCMSENLWAELSCCHGDQSACLLDFKVDDRPDDSIILREGIEEARGTPENV